MLARIEDILRSIDGKMDIVIDKLDEIAGDIVDHRDGTLSIKMGRLTELEEAYETSMSLMRAIQANDSTADLAAQIDTFSYAMGLSQTQGLKGFIMYRMGVDTTYMADFVKGLKTGIKAGDNAKQTAF